jgi:heme oxygenase
VVVACVETGNPEWQRDCCGGASSSSQSGSSNGQQSAAPSALISCLVAVRGSGDSDDRPKPPASSVFTTKKIMIGETRELTTGVHVQSSIGEHNSWGSSEREPRSQHLLTHSEEVEVEMALARCIEPSSIRDRLRRSTAALHARVDKSMVSILQQGAEGYVRFLQTSASAILPIEHALTGANVSSLLPDWQQRTRSLALKSDLASLSAAVPANNPLSWTHLQDESYQYGVLYVLEGSRLGARVILQALRKEPSHVHGNALSYLSHGEGKPFWPTFLAHLEASEAARTNPETAVAGALATFQMFLSRSEPFWAAAQSPREATRSKTRMMGF